MQFENFKLNQEITRGLQTAGFITPTPIQARAIPVAIQGRDLMGLAQTGTGKTAAFVLPLLQRLMHGERNRVRALVVAPTRELAEQINETICLLAQHTQLRSMTIYGGVSIVPQIRTLKRGVDILVACPGRLLDHLNQKTIDLSQVEMLVLDEADRMFDMGFLPGIRKIVQKLPKQRQTLLFSATMPKEILKLAQEMLRNPETIQVDRIAPPVTVSHALYPVAQHLKTDLLLQLLKQTPTESVLVFTRTKHRAKRLGEKLGRVGYQATSLQGNLSQARRQQALNGFRDGSYQILVATDIAARGIDVSQISHVVNFDIPDTPEAYIHRIGRTGRAARSGAAFTLIGAEDQLMVKAIERTLGTQIQRCQLPDFNYASKGQGTHETPTDKTPAVRTAPAKAAVKSSNNENARVNQTPRRRRRNARQNSAPNRVAGNQRAAGHS
jgi:ATP-dependent RNA helicase RhlE